MFCRLLRPRTPPQSAILRPSEFDPPDVSFVAVDPRIPSAARPAVGLVAAAPVRTVLVAAVLLGARVVPTRTLWAVRPRAAWTASMPAAAFTVLTVVLAAELAPVKRLVTAVVADAPPTLDFVLFQLAALRRPDWRIRQRVPDEAVADVRVIAALEGPGWRRASPRLTASHRRNC